MTLEFYFHSCFAWIQKSSFLRKATDISINHSFTTLFSIECPRIQFFSPCLIKGTQQQSDLVIMTLAISLAMWSLLATI